MPLPNSAVYRRVHRRAFLPGTIAFLVGLSLAFPSAAGAATFVVDTELDVHDSDPGDGVCAGFGNQEEIVCSLRAAVQEANALAGADTIELPAGNYFLTIPGNSENAAAQGDLDITDSLTIHGSGPDSTIIDAGEIRDRVFEIQGLHVVDISDVAITGGEATPLGGGAILNNGDLSLTNCALNNNTADSAVGGGAILNNDLLTMSTCVVSNNSANYSTVGGGGILNQGTATLSSCEISGNEAKFITSGGGGGVASLDELTLEHCEISGNSAEDSDHGGGGIYYNGKELNVLDSTISGNQASVGFERCSSMAGGGGLSIFDSFVLVSGTTISGNSANFGCEAQPQGGGGVYITDAGSVFFVNTTISGNESNSSVQGGGGVLSDFSSLSVFNCTITDNHVNNATFQNGGGISLVDKSHMEYENTVLAGNRVDGSTSGDGDCARDLYSEFLSGGYNIIGDDTGCDDDGETDFLLAGSEVGDILGPLQNNGGPTDTHALLAGENPAIDGGDPFGCEFDDATAAGQPLLADQRGFFRPVDGDLDLVAVCDVGSYEFEPAAAPNCNRQILVEDPTTTVRGLATDDLAGDTGIFDIQLLDAINVELVEPDFDEGDPQVQFTVNCIDPTPEDGQCDGSGTVQATDGEGLMCVLDIEFRAVPEGPLEDFVLCEGDGTLLQITNPVPDSGDPITPPGTAACTSNPFNDDEPAPGEGRDPFEQCDVFTLDSPVAGLTEMVYKVEIDNLLLRLMFSEFDENTMEFLPFVDITETVKLIVEVIPDPTRLGGKSNWSPVKIMCALPVEVDCNDPANLDVDLDMDGFSPCPSDPNALVDCDDRIDFIHPPTDGPELCNGMDDNCDGNVDEGLDSDGDGVADCFDNCPDDFNPPEICDPALPPFQCDTDGDGIGDACDGGEDELPDDEQDEDFGGDPTLTTPTLSGGPEEDEPFAGPPQEDSGRDAPGRRPIRRGPRRAPGPPA